MSDETVRARSDASTTNEIGRRRRDGPIGRVVALAIAAALVVSICAVPVSAAGAGTANAANDATLSIEDVEVEPGETATAEVWLSDIPDGLSGFNVTVAVEGDDVAIEESAVNESFGIHEIKAQDDDSMTILRAADLNREFEPGEGPVMLGTVTISAESAGEATLSLSNNGIDSDDDGSDIPVSIDDGTVTVGEEASNADDGGDGGDSDAQSDTASESDDNTLANVWVVVVALVGGGAVILTVVVVARRQF